MPPSRRWMQSCQLQNCEHLVRAPVAILTFNETVTLGAYNEENDSDRDPRPPFIRVHEFVAKEGDDESSESDDDDSGSER